MDHENNNLYADTSNSHNSSSTFHHHVLLGQPQQTQRQSPAYPPIPTPAGRPRLQYRKYRVSRRFPRERHDDRPSCPIAFIVDGSAGTNSSRHHGNLNASSMLKNEQYQTAAHLRVRVQIPQVELTRPVSGTEHRRMEGMLLDIIRVIVRRFEGVNRRNGRSVWSRCTRSPTSRLSSSISSLIWREGVVRVH